MFTKEQLLSALRTFKDQQLAGGEAALALGSSALAEIPAGISGVGALMMGRGPEEAAANVEWWRNQGYKPNDPSALQAIGESAVGGVLEDYEQGNRTRGQMAQDAGAGPGLATLTSMAPDIAMGLVSLPRSMLSRALMNASGAGTRGGFAGSRQIGAVGKDVGRGKGGAPLTPEEAKAAAEARLIRSAGKKAAREKNLSAKVAAQTPKDKATRESVGKRVALSPDHLREMERLLGKEATMKAIKRGIHLKPDGYGGFIGAPRTVTDKNSLTGLRRNLTRQLEEAAHTLQISDPERVGNWYPRYRGGIEDSTTPSIIDEVLDEHAVYSQRASVEAELGKALTHRNSRVVGKPKRAGMPDQEQALDTARATGQRAKLGPKTGHYRRSIDPRNPYQGMFGVNDFRALQNFHYTDKAGVPMEAASDTMHPFMDAETALLVERANDKAIGGLTDWNGPRVQEAPWIVDRAQDLFSRGNDAAGSGRYVGDPVEMFKLAVRDANKTVADYTPKHTFSETYEHIPGANTGHRADVLNMSPEEKLAYAQQARWDTLPNNMDVLYDAVGFRQTPTMQGSGQYTNTLGIKEKSPNQLGNVLVNYEAGGSGLVDPDTMGLVKALARWRGGIGAQEAVAGNLVNIMKSPSGKNAVLLESEFQPTSSQLAAIDDAIGDSGYFAVPNRRGVALIRGDGAGNPKTIAELMKKYGPQISKIYESKASPGKQSSFYEPFPDEPNPSNPTPGRLTEAVLNDWLEYPEIAEKLVASPEVNKVVFAHIARDAGHPQSRVHVENMRRFLVSDAFPKAVRLIKAGAKPAAALASLGLSMSAMAEETPQQRK